MRLTFCLLLLCLCGAMNAASEKPPEGAPWKTDFVEAHKEAIEKGKPIFAYFTKTY